MSKNLTPANPLKSEKPKAPDRECDSVRMSSSLRPEGFRKSYSWRKKNKVCAVVFLFLTASIVLHFLKFTNSSNLEKIKRIKRQLQTIDSRKRQYDIEIVPESRKYHPNHRYEAGEPETALRLKSRRGWSAPRSERDRHPHSIQDIILKGKVKGPGAEGQGQLPNELSSGSTVRLKGIYMHPGSEGLFGSHWDDIFYDSNEINNLMRNDSGPVGKRPVKRRFRSPGAPFKLPGKGAGPVRPKTRPITIYLDFYPTKPLDELRRRKPDSGVLTPFDKFGNPALIHPSNAGEYLPARESPNGIIMKLNLYPKESTISEWNSDRQTHHSRYNKRAEKKSFGWFSKHEKKKKEEEEEDRPKGCSIVGLNPRGKRITAKWKNEKGEWIHAEHVDIKYLKKGKD